MQRRGKHDRQIRDSSHYILLLVIASFLLSVFLCMKLKCASCKFFLTIKLLSLIFVNVYVLFKFKCLS